MDSRFLSFPKLSGIIPFVGVRLETFVRLHNCLAENGDVDLEIVVFNSGTSLSRIPHSFAYEVAISILIGVVSLNDLMVTVLSVGVMLSLNAIIAPLPLIKS